jgi:hypothetical protein
MADKGQDGLADKMLSKEDAWAKARGIMDKFRNDEEKRFGNVGGFLNLRDGCIEVRVSFRSADIPGLSEMISGTEYFIGMKEKEDVLKFPYAVYKVPYETEESRPVRQQKGYGYL